jgi:hypothetical protein
LVVDIYINTKTNMYTMNKAKTFEQFANESIVTEGKLGGAKSTLGSVKAKDFPKDFSLLDMIDRYKSHVVNYVNDIDESVNEGKHYEDETRFKTKNGQIAHIDDRMGDKYYITYYDKNGNEKDDGEIWLKDIEKNIKIGKWIAESVNEAKEISKSQIDMMGSKILNKIKIGTKFVTDGGDYIVTGFGRKANAFQEYDAEKDGQPCKVKLTAMYGVKLEVTDDPRSAVYRKEEHLTSILNEDISTWGIREGNSNKEFPILSIGATNLDTGKSKYWNFYDEWLKDGNMTCEIYKGNGYGKGHKFVFTSGKGTIGGIEPGERRVFMDDQTRRFLFEGTLLGFAPIEELKEYAKQNGYKSGTGYVYK